MCKYCQNNIPNHIAIIMDGNGRWAKMRGKERIEGHYEGVVSVRSSIISAINFGIKYLTVYAFSTENWGRPEDEVEGLMELFCKTISMEISSLKEQSVKVNFFGNLDKLSAEVRESIDFCTKSTAEGNKLTLSIALNYGAREELTFAARKIAQDVKNGVLNIEDITDDSINARVMTKGIPDPDLIIRTSGEQRLSNFLLWQSAYTELYFTDILWPDFREEAFKQALAAYAQRTRKYGKV